MSMVLASLFWSGNFLKAKWSVYSLVIGKLVSSSMEGMVSGSIDGIAIVE